MDAPDDDQLEQALRAGLDRHADEAEVDRGLVARAAADARGRRTTRRWAVLGAAAAVVAVVGATAVVTRGDDEPSGLGTLEQDVPLTTLPPSAVGPVRTEYWKGVQVDVPVSWGYGNPASCGDVPTGEPYVGRPIGITDACMSPDPDAIPTAPYVWFDVEGVEPGTVELGGGFRRQTVEVDGTRVSVAARDATTVESVLETVRTGDLCAPTIPSQPRPRFDWTREGGGAFESARLCAYRVGDLVYATPIDRATYERTVSAVDGAAVTAEPCATGSSETVVVTGLFDDAFGSRPLRRDLVFDLSCGVVLERGTDGPAGDRTRVLTEQSVPWAPRGGVFTRLLTGPLDGNWVYRRFIGVQG